MNRTSGIWAGALVIALASPQVTTAEQAPALDLTPPDTSYVTRTDEAGNRSAEAQGTAATFAFSNLDTNRNMSISRSEAAASEQLRDQFDQVDSNHDFQITPSEFSAFEVQEMRAQQQTVPSAAADDPQQGSISRGTETGADAAGVTPGSTSAQ